MSARNTKVYTVGGDSLVHGDRATAVDASVYRIRQSRVNRHVGDAVTIAILGFVGCVSVFVGADTLVDVVQFPTPVICNPDSQFLFLGYQTTSRLGGMYE